MRATSLLILGTLLTACTGPVADDPGDTGDANVTADPDVDTYLPPGLALSAPTRVVFMGDSITAGVGAARDSLTYTSLMVANDDRKWPTFADLDLETALPSVTEVIDVSVSGATTSTLIGQQLPALQNRLAPSADGDTLVVVTIGGNDAQRALSPTADPADIIDRTLGNVEDIVATLQEAPYLTGDIAIYVTNVYEPTDGTGSFEGNDKNPAGCFFGLDISFAKPELLRYNREFRALGEEMGFGAVDLAGHFAGHGWNAQDDTLDVYDADDPSTWFDTDCIHPNNRGHHEIRRLFMHALLGEALPLWRPDRSAAPE